MEEEQGFGKWIAKCNNCTYKGEAPSSKAAADMAAAHIKANPTHKVDVYPDPDQKDPRWEESE